MRNVARAILIPVASLFALAVIFEAGLRLRALIPPAPGPVHQLKSSHRILFIADSVFGFASKEGSAAANTVAKLRESGEPFEIFELSRPALRTQGVLRELPEALEKFKPSVVVLMVGKSDYRRGIEFPEWFYGLRVSRLISYVINEIQRQYFILAKTPKPDLNLAYDKGWSLFGSQKYEEAIVAFESAARRYPSDEDGLRALYFSYLTSGKFREGREFFADIAPKSEIGVLLKTFVRGLELADSQTSPAARALAIEALKKLADEDMNLRGATKTRLFSEKKRHDSARFSAILSTLAPNQNAKMLNSTADNLVLAADQITKTGARIIFLQYPTEHAKSLEDVFSTIRGQVEIYDTRLWLLEQEKAPFPIDSIEEDIEHLTGAGAAEVGSRVARIILLR